MIAYRGLVRTGSCPVIILLLRAPTPLADSANTPILRDCYRPGPDPLSRPPPRPSSLVWLPTGGKLGTVNQRWPRRFVRPVMRPRTPFAGGRTVTASAAPRRNRTAGCGAIRTGDLPSHKLTPDALTFPSNSQQFSKKSRDRTKEGSMRHFSSTAAPWIPLVAVFPVTGYFVGWLTGSSITPVVGTLLPLVFALLGALSWKSLSEGAASRKLIETIQEKLTSEEITAIASQLSDQRSRIWLGAFWALGVTLFSIAAFLGTKAGIAVRIPQYPALNQMSNLSCVSPMDRSRLYGIRWDFLGRGIPADDATQAFQDVLVPLLTIGDEENRQTKLDAACDHMGVRKASPQIGASNRQNGVPSPAPAT